VDNLLLGRRFVDDDFAVLQVDRHGEIIRLLLLLVVRVFRRKGSETCQRGPVKGKMVRITNSWLRRDIVTFPKYISCRGEGLVKTGFPTSFFRSEITRRQRTMRYTQARFFSFTLKVMTWRF